jgi:hypothetical protein
LAGDKTFKRSGQARSKGRALLLVMSKQNLNPSYWCIWCTKNCQKRNKIEKVTDPKVEGFKNSKNKPLNPMKVILEHPKNSFYVAIRVQR